MHYCTRNPSKLPHICIVWSPQMGNLMTPAKTCHQTSWWLNPAMWKILKHSRIGSWNPKVWGEHSNYVWNLHPAHHVVSLWCCPTAIIQNSRPSFVTKTTGPHLPTPSDATCKKWVAVSTNAMKGNEPLLLHTGGMYIFKNWYNIDQRSIAREKQTPTKRTSRIHENFCKNI